MFLSDFNSIHHVLDLENFSVVPNVPRRQTGGSYCICDGVFTALYFQDRRLILQVTDRKMLIEPGLIAKIEKLDNSTERRFLLFSDKDVLVSFDYCAEEAFNDLSPWEWLPDEEFDWGLWLVNIINNPERQKIMANGNID